MIKYNKTNIIVLALIYNYLAKRETKIKKNYFEMFFSELNYELLLKEHKMINEEESEQNVYIEKDNYIEFSICNRLPYSLIELKRKYVDFLPNEIIGATLSANVLSALKINRNDISMNTCLEPIYLLNDSNLASERIKRILKLNPISIPTTYHGNICYSVEREVIDIDSIIEEYESKQK